MIQKSVLISVKGTQRSDGEEPQVLELTTDGQLYDEDGVLCVSYVESAVTGMEGVVTTFHVEPDRVRLVREGAVNATMTFIAGERTESLYDLGFGAVLLGITACRVESQLDMDGGSFFIDYAVEVERVPVASHTYEISVRERA